MARFKKGSPQAKAWGRKMARLRSPKKRRSYSTTKLKAKRTMAKRKYTRKSTKRRSSKKGFSIMGISMAKMLSAAGYGAIRARTSNLISPYTSKLPLGNIADEVGMMALAVAGKKFLFKKAGLARDVLSAGQIIEMARIGDAAVSGQLNLPFLNGTTSTPLSNSNIF